MATTQSISPGGALLRASRLFAIPAPLPRPKAKFEVGSVFGVDGGTAPYPLHQSITTPPSSLSRGDWGLKRPLPLRSTTKTSTPAIRVTTIDTFEHVTDFVSAADHTLTLKKWQELNLPLFTPSAKSRRNILAAAVKEAPRSVFEEDLDYTAPRKTKPGQQTMRWKFGGPWLAGQTEMEFNDYLKKEVRRRKTEFQHFLRQEYVNSHNLKMMEKARHDGQIVEDIPGVITLSDVTDEQFNIHLRKLRRDEVALYTLIRQFFDLPPSPQYTLSLKTLNTSYQLGDLEQKKLGDIPASDNSVETSNPYAASGPPKTHPSAGLSYLRSAAHITNHPLFGPQSEHPPVQGRVVMPRNAAVGSFGPKLGVAGVLVDAPSLSGFRTENLARKGQSNDIGLPIRGLDSIEPEVHGGSKVWLKLKGASLDSNGMVQLSTSKASERSVNMIEGKPFEAPSNPRTFRNAVTYRNGKFEGRIENPLRQADHDARISRVFPEFETELKPRLGPDASVLDILGDSLEK